LFQFEKPKDPILRKKTLAPSFPTLSALKVQAHLKKTEINIFGQSKKTETLVLEVHDGFRSMKAPDIAQRIILSKSQTNFSFTIIPITSLSQ